MNDSLGLIIDFVFDEDKINKDAERLLDNLKKNNQLEIGFDSSLLTELAKSVQNISNTKFVLDENGKQLKSIQNLNLGLGRTLNIVNDIETGAKSISFDVNNAKLEQEVLKDVDKTLSEITKKRKELLNASGSQEVLLERELVSLEKHLDLLRDKSINNQMFEKIQERVLKNDEKIYAQNRKEQALAEDYLETQRQIYKEKISILKSGKLGDFVDTDALDDVVARLKLINAFSTTQVKEELKSVEKAFKNIEDSAKINDDSYKTTLSVMDAISKKEKEIVNLSGVRNKIAKEEREQLVLTLSNNIESIKHDKTRAKVLEEISNKHKDIYDQLEKEKRIAEEVLDIEKKKAISEVDSFKQSNLGSFGSTDALDNYINKLNSVKAFSSKQVVGEIKKIKDEFGSITLDAKVEKGVYDEVVRLVTEISNKEKELINTTGDRQKLVQKEYNELVKNLGVQLDQIENQNTYNRVLEKTNELSKRSQSLIEKEKASANEKVEAEKRILSLKLQSIKTGKNAEYINVEHLQKIESAIRQLNGVSLKQVTSEVGKLKIEIDELGSDANAKRILATSNAVKSLSDKLRDMGVYATIDIGDIIGGVKNTIGKGVDYVKELDEAYTDVAISMDITRDAFAEWTNDARAIAQANGQMTTSAMDMVKIYASAGEEIGDIADRLEGTLQIQNITQWNAEQTTSAVNSIVNQYKLLEKEIDGTTGNISNAIQYAGDALVGISNELKVDNVTGIQEMIEAIDTAGGVMEQSGASMEWYMAVAGTLNETMAASGSEIGNAWKMISARVFSQAQAMEELGESSETVKIEALKAEKALNSVGISVREAGDPSKLRSLQDILDDLAKKWDKLSDATKNYVAEGVAGNNRRNFFVSTMENYDRVLTLTNAGMNAQGELAKASEVRVNSLAGQTAILTDKFLSLMDGLNPVLYGLVDLGNAALDIAHSFGAIPTTIGLVSAAFLTLSDSGRQLSSTIIEAISPLNNLNTFLMKKAGIMKEVTNCYE